jgi:beta-glucanase (GH16 family)
MWRVEAYNKMHNFEVQHSSEFMKHIFFSAFLMTAVFIAKAQKDTSSFFEDFNDTTSKNFRYGSTGSKAGFKWKMGAPSPTEPGTKILSFKIDPQDSAGAGRGPEIISKNYTHYGSYSARLKVPNVKDVQPNVGAVVGYFTYNVDSIPGLSEIDFEWLIADPSIIYIGTWTGHHGELKRIGRTINLAKGTILSTIYKVNYNGPSTPLNGMQNLPETIPAIPGYDASAKFYTYGFDWYPDRLRWWIIDPTSGEKIVLWDYQGSKVGVPENHSLYRMNFWHTNNWGVEGNPNAIEKPVSAYELEVDWMRYDGLK